MPAQSAGVKAAACRRLMDKRNKEKEGGGNLGLLLPVEDVFGLQKLGLPAEAGVALFALQK